MNGVSSDDHSVCVHLFAAAMEESGRERGRGSGEGKRDPGNNPAAGRRFDDGFVFCVLCRGGDLLSVDAELLCRCKRGIVAGDDCVVRLPDLRWPDAGEAVVGSGFEPDG